MHRAVHTGPGFLRQRRDRMARERARPCGVHGARWVARCQMPWDACAGADGSPPHLHTHPRRGRWKTPLLRKKSSTGYSQNNAHHAKTQPAHRAHRDGINLLYYSLLCCSLLCYSLLCCSLLRQLATPGCRLLKACLMQGHAGPSMDSAPCMASVASVRML